MEESVEPYIPSYIMQLEKEYTAVEDISDPTLIDGILTCLEEIQAEDEEFMKVLLEKCDEMIITWPLPWYQQSQCLTRPLKEPNDNKLEKFRTDTICFEESNKMHKNWRKFRKVFGVPNRPDCLARWRNKESCRNPTSPEEFVRRFVICFLAHGLERNLYQVYKHFIVRYSTPVKGPYLKYEENIMDICIHHCSRNSVPDLAIILGREPRGLYKRLLQKMSGTRLARKRHKWTIPRATQLLNLLMKYSGESLENLKNKTFDKSIWLKIEDEMDHNYLYLQRFWYKTLHVQLFVKYEVKIRRLRKKVLKRIRLHPYKVWGDIRWKEISKEFSDGFTHIFLYEICSRLFSNYNGYRRDSIENLIEYGLRKAKSIRDRRLKTLALNDNQELEIIEYNTKLK